jgi:anti-sigma-K factor RskA
VNLNDPQDRSVAAGEYVMGTLDANERAAFETALTTDAALQAEVYAWQDKLMSLALRVPPAEPAPATWAGIEARLARPAVGAHRGATPPEAARRGEAANDPFWRRVGLWQTISGLAVAACLVMATLLVVRPPGAALDADRYLTLLQAPDKSTGWLVEVSASKKTLRLVPLNPTENLPPGKAMQFWTKLDGAAGPTSLGLVRPGQVTEVPLSQLPGVAEKQLFELTLEPETGSPIGRPTGPILYVGRSVRI